MVCMGRQKEKLVHFVYSIVQVKSFYLRRRLKISDYILVFGGRGRYLHEKNTTKKGFSATRSYCIAQGTLLNIL